MRKIISTDHLYPDTSIEEEAFNTAGFKWEIARSKDIKTLIEECQDADGVMVTFADMPAEVINSMEKCKIIVRTGIGVNNIDIAAATEKKIMVANVLDYCTDEVSDHAMALALTLLRKTYFMNKRIKQGIWDMNEARPIPRLRGLTLALFGFGSIARKLAEKAKPFGFKVVAYDPFIPSEIFTQCNVKRIDDLDELFSCADVLSTHIPLLKENQGIINYDKLKMMKKSAIFINTARGLLVNEKDLYQALDEGLIAGAGLDVLSSEYPDLKHPLVQMDNVVITPHMAFYSDGSDIELRQKSCQQVIMALKEGQPEYFVNKKALGY